MVFDGFVYFSLPENSDRLRKQLFGRGIDPSIGAPGKPVDLTKSIRCIFATPKIEVAPHKT